MKYFDLTHSSFFYQSTIIHTRTISFDLYLGKKYVVNHRYILKFYLENIARYFMGITKEQNNEVTSRHVKSNVILSVR